MGLPTFCTGIHPKQLGKLNPKRTYQFKFSPEQTQLTLAQVHPQDPPPRERGSKYRIEITAVLMLIGGKKYGQKGGGVGVYP